MDAQGFVQARPSFFGPVSQEKTWHEKRVIYSAVPGEADI